LLEIEEFKELYEKILAIWEKKKEEYDYSIQIGFEKGKDISHLFPPCIKNILSQAKQGKNLSHTERLFLTFFLLALDYPTEKVVDVFSTMPDFDREKTRYQVNFAKKKEYTPHSCRKLKSLNLCKASKYSDELCLDGYYSKTKDEERELSHPLFYVQYQQYKKSKKKYGEQ
jgi:DNA primase large subunit